NYASKINGLVQSIFVMSITTVLFPLLSRLATKEKFEKIKTVIIQAVEALAIFLIPLSIIIFYNTNIFVSIIYGRGAFDQSSIETTSSALKYYSLAMFFIG